MRRSLGLILLGCSFTLLTGCPGDDPKPETGIVNPDDTGVQDADGDGYNSDEDCDDNNAATYPGATEECDGVDNDCDDEIDEDVMNTYYADGDGDGFGTSDDSQDACESPKGYVAVDGDCNDSDGAIYPNAEELCDGFDNDCDDEIDEGWDDATWYADGDGDGFGNSDDTTTACEQPVGYVANGDDCDDSTAGEPVLVTETGTLGSDTGSRGGPPGPPGGGPDTADSGGFPFGDTSDSGSGLPPFGDTSDSSVPGSDSGAVPADSGGDSGGDSGAPADGQLVVDSIQEAIDLSDACVYVYAGTYTEDINFNGKSILVMGVDGNEVTTIEGTGSSSTVTFASGESEDAELTGFTITGGVGTMSETVETDDCTSQVECTTTTTEYFGGGIYVNGAAPTLHDLVIAGNELASYAYSAPTAYDEFFTFSYGGGVYLADTAIALEDVTIENNGADSGGGLFVADTAVVSLKWAMVDANSACAGAGLASEGASTAANSIFVNNAYGAPGFAGTCAGNGGAGVDVAAGSANLTNVDVVGNDSTYASVYLSSSGSVTAINSIIADNDDGAMLDGEVGTTLAITYSDVYGAATANYGVGFTDVTGIDGNISEDPMFVAWTDDDSSADDDFSLDAASPCIDAGDSAPSYNDADGSANDMGAYGGPEGEW